MFSKFSFKRFLEKQLLNVHIFLLIFSKKTSFCLSIRATIRIGARRVYRNILSYSRTPDSKYSRCLSRFACVLPEYSRILESGFKLNALEYSRCTSQYGVRLEYSRIPWRDDCVFDEARILYGIF